MSYTDAKGAQVIRLSYEGIKHSNCAKRARVRGEVRQGYLKSDVHVPSAPFECVRYSLFLLSVPNAPALLHLYIVGYRHSWNMSISFQEMFDLYQGNRVEIVYDVNQ